MPHTSDLLEKLALIFLYNFHRDYILLTLKKKKKVIAENQCEKHKKLEFSLVCIALNVRNGTESKYPPVVFRVYFIDTDEGLARDWALALPLFLNKFAADDKWLVEYEKK